MNDSIYEEMEYLKSRLENLEEQLKKDTAIGEKPPMPATADDVGCLVYTIDEGRRSFSPLEQGPYVLQHVTKYFDQETGEMDISFEINGTSWPKAYLWQGEMPVNMSPNEGRAPAELFDFDRDVDEYITLLYFDDGTFEVTTTPLDYDWSLPSHNYDKIPKILCYALLKVNMI